MAKTQEVTNIPEIQKTKKINLEYDKKHRAPKFFSVNGRTYLVKRGMNVEVPESVAEIYEESKRAVRQALAYEDSVRDKN